MNHDIGEGNCAEQISCVFKYLKVLEKFLYFSLKSNRNRRNVFSKFRSKGLERYPGKANTKKIKEKWERLRKTEIMTFLVIISSRKDLFFTEK